MSYLFTDCSIIIDIILNQFDTSNVENMESMFSGLSEMTSF